MADWAIQVKIAAYKSMRQRPEYKQPPVPIGRWLPDSSRYQAGEFLEIVKPLFGREREKKELAKVFQALRIEVNQEMEALKEMLYAATEALKPGGRLVVITYHSLEDRMVKNIMKTGNVEGKAEKDFFGNVLTPFRLVNNKVIVPDEKEIERNPRSRSAKLRIAERIMND